MQVLLICKLIVVSYQINWESILIGTFAYFYSKPDPTRHDYFTISSPGAPPQPVICGTMQVVIMDDSVDGDSGDDRYVIICHMWHHAGSDDNGDEVRIVLMVMLVLIKM